MLNRFSGVNSLCKNCSKSCKQYANVTVVQCLQRKERKFKTSGGTDTSVLEKSV